MIWKFYVLSPSEIYNFDKNNNNNNKNNRKRNEHINTASHSFGKLYINLFLRMYSIVLRKILICVGDVVRRQCLNYFYILLSFARCYWWTTGSSRKRGKKNRNKPTSDNTSKYTHIFRFLFYCMCVVYFVFILYIIFFLLNFIF